MVPMLLSLALEKCILPPKLRGSRSGDLLMKSIGAIGGMDSLQLPLAMCTCAFAFSQRTALAHARSSLLALAWTWPLGA